MEAQRGEYTMTQPENGAAEPQKPLHPEHHPAPIPDPEPPSPPLDEPDPAVFHHTPTRPKD